LDRKVGHRFTLKPPIKEGKETVGGGGALDEVVLEVGRESRVILYYGSLIFDYWSLGLEIVPPIRAELPAANE
jgi:hypothetical protein